MSLRLSLMLFLGIVLLGCAQSDANQKAAAQRIEALGGKVGLYSEADVSAEGVPKHFKGKIGSVFLENLDLRGVDLAAIVPPESTRTLSLRGAQIDERQLSSLAKCQQLTTLDISSTAAGDLSFGYVGQIVGLQLLYADRTPATDKGLALLTKCKQLREVQVRDTLVTTSGIKQFQDSLPHLKVVLWSTAPSDRVRESLIALERNGAEITAGTQQRLDNEKLHGPIRYSITFGPTWQDGNEDHDVSSLQAIVDAAPTSIALLERHAQVLGWLKQSPGVYKLFLGDGVSLTDADLDALTKNAKARILHLQAPLMSAEGFRLIARLGNLEHLTLDNVPVEKTWVKEVSELKKLKTISIWNADCSDGVIGELLQLSSLQQVELQSCPNVTSISVNKLRKKGIKVTIEEGS